MTAYSKAPSWVSRVLDYWHRAEVTIALIAFALIAILLVYDVVAREVLSPLVQLLGAEHTNVGLRHSQRISVYLLIVGAFSGIGIATWTGVQLVPKMGFGAVPEAWSDNMDRLADGVTALFLIGVTIVGFIFVASSREIGLMASGGLPIEVWKVQLAVPLGFGSAAIRYLAFVIWPSSKPSFDGEPGGDIE